MTFNVEDKLDEIHEDVKEVKRWVNGHNGTDGAKVRIDRLEQAYEWAVRILKWMFWILGGAITLGIAKRAWANDGGVLMNYGELITDILVIYIPTAIGAASLIAQTITLVTGVTPSKKDDEFASTFTRWVGRAQDLIHRLALNPRADKARK